MAKKKGKRSVATKESGCCTWSGCKKGDLVWTLVAEAAIYGFFYCGLRYLGSAGNLWQNALVLLVLINVAWFACPIARKHFYCN